MTCITFQRSLEILMLDPCSSYGAKTGCAHDIGCTDIWTAEKREWWMGKLRAAELQIERRLGAPICPKQVRDEAQPLKTIIRTRQAPIAYLGVKTRNLVNNYAMSWGTKNAPFKICGSYVSGYITIPDAEIPAGITVDDLIFEYPEQYCGNGYQVLQEPCYTLEGTNHIFAWATCQLVKPDIDEASVLEAPPNSYIANVDVYYETIDASQAVVLPPGCGCDVSEGTITVEISDPIAGEVCLTGACNFSGQRIYLNYGTAFGPSDRTDVDDDLAEAIVLLALTMTGHRNLCGCEDFQETVAYWLEPSPDAQSALTTPDMLPYGGTNAGMAILRIMDRFVTRPHYNQPVQTSGMITAGKARSLPIRRIR